MMGENWLLALSVQKWEWLPQLRASSFPIGDQQLSHRLQLNETNRPAALLLKPQSGWHDKCLGANNSQADDDPHRSLVMAGVQQSICWADWLVWLGWCACVRRTGIIEEGRQQRKYLQGAEGRICFHQWKRFPKKELSLFTLLPSFVTLAPGPVALRGSSTTYNKTQYNETTQCF